MFFGFCLPAERSVSKENFFFFSGESAQKFDFIFMSTLDTVKNTILSEIEESLLGGKTSSILRSKLSQVSSSLLLFFLFFFSFDFQSGYHRGSEYYERDFAIGGAAIRRVIEFGLDSQFSLDLEVFPDFSTN
jgi:hypothetical protein